jgi:hypothetical protein
MIAPLIGIIVGFGVVFLARIWSRRRHPERQVVKAYRLARQVDLLLPTELVGRVVRHVRRNEDAGFVVLVCVAPWLNATMWAGLGTAPNGPIQGPQPWQIAVLLGAFPMAVILGTALVAWWGRWRASSPRRVAHLGRPSMWILLTGVEIAVVAVGAVSAAVMGFAVAWTFVPSARDWAWTAPALVAASLGATVLVARKVWQAPAEGSDSWELAWDDALRSLRVRVLLLGVPIILAGTSSLTAAWAANQAAFASRSAPDVFSHAWVLGLAWFGALALLGSGRGPRRWRRLWPDAPSAGAVVAPVAPATTMTAAHPVGGTPRLNGGPATTGVDRQSRR